MADDSNLVEFSLTPEATESEAPEVSTQGQPSQATTVLHQHIENVIRGNINPAISGSTTYFINQYWQPLMVNVAEQHGTDSMKWREVVKMLHKFSLYLLPETKMQHPQVATSLLPALIQNMKQALLDFGLADEALEQQFNDIRFGSSASATTTKASNSEAQVVTSEPEVKAETVEEAPLVDVQTADTDSESALEFVIEDEKSAEQEEVELDLLAEQLEAEAIDDEPEPLELEAFDLESDFAVDINDPDNQVEVVAKPEPKKPSADDLPPLELDLE